jgi:predicted ArsR family transcriptional regulator
VIRSRHLIREKQMVKCSRAEVRRLRTALHWKISAAQRERIQMVLLRESGLTQPEIAAALGVSLSTVNRAHMAYDEGGIKALKPKPNGGRKHENMTLVEEKALLARFAKAAGAGEMLNIHDLKAAYEKAMGTRPATARFITSCTDTAGAS